MPSGGVIPVSSIAPRVEPEIAVVLGADLASAKFFLSLEVVDSVWQDYKFTWAHNTADQLSSSFAVLGPEIGAEITQSQLLELISPLKFGVAGSAHLHSDLGSSDLDISASIAWHGGVLAGMPRELHSGDVVLTGGLSAPIPLDPGGTIECELAMKQSPSSPHTLRHRVEVSRER